MRDCCRFASRLCSAWGKVASAIITQPIIELKGWEEMEGRLLHRLNQDGKRSWHKEMLG